MSHRILIVEDDASIRHAVSDALEAHGYRVDRCADGASAIAAATRSPPNLVLLDAGLPDTDGFTLCRRWRQQHPDLPIVLVTARHAEIDVVVGLDAGASDYVTKPFSMSVLLARIRAHLRNVDGMQSDDPIQIGAVRVDPATYLATVDGQPVDLRRREFELLVRLGREVNRVVTRERLLGDVWDLHWTTSSKTLDMHVLALRRKLGDAIEIATVRGVGYRLVAP